MDLEVRPMSEKKVLPGRLNKKILKDSYTVYRKQLAPEIRPEINRKQLGTPCQGRISNKEHLSIRILVKKLSLIILTNYYCILSA